MSNNQTFPQPDEFDNEWLCPYCARPTAPADTQCPHCCRTLVVKKRVLAERSVWLWRGFFLQIYIATYVVIFGLGMWLLQRSFPKSIPNIPVWFFGVLLVIVLYSLGVMGLLYFRVPFAHFLYLLNAGLMLTLGMLGLLAFDSTGAHIGGGLGLLLGFFQVGIAVNLWKDFSFVTGRFSFTIDSSATNATSLFLSARQYARQGMWGKAVIHLRRAVLKNAGNISYRLALIAAYINLKRYDRAAQTWQDAHRLAPDNAKLAELQTILNKMQRTTHDPNSGINRY